MADFLKSTLLSGDYSLNGKITRVSSKICSLTVYTVQASKKRLDEEEI